MVNIPKLVVHHLRSVYFTCFILKGYGYTRRHNGEQIYLDVQRSLTFVNDFLVNRSVVLCLWCNSDTTWRRSVLHHIQSTTVVWGIKSTKASTVHDNKALFEEDMAGEFLISEVSSYTGLRITALAAYILRSISTNEKKQFISQMFSFATTLQGDLKCIGLHQSTF